MRMVEITDDASFRDVRDLVCGALAGQETERAMDEKSGAVRDIVDAVRERGDEAVAELTERFDGVALRPEQFEVTADMMDKAIAEVEPSLISILERAHENIRGFHSKRLRQSWEETAEDGTVLGQRVTPIKCAGVYVPGGKAFYPSSVLMNIVPARVAGVKEIVLVSPPSWNGGIHPVVLAAARIAGATRVFRIGGAQAVAALAYGTERVPAVLKITGPGNVYVTLAKRIVSTVREIDTEAGPSEVLVIADAKADARYAAAEMLAQAEHDEDARAILLTPSKELAGRVMEELDKQMQALPRKDMIQQALDAQGLVAVVRNLDDAICLANAIAPEHLSVQTEYPRQVFDKIENAGAVMLGAMTPVAAGDYYAGPNHILPTGRRARFASPLTAEDFRKVTSIISYSRERLLKDADDIERFAEVEGLTAHARAVEIRK